MRKILFISGVLFTLLSCSKDNNKPIVTPTVTPNLLCKNQAIISPELFEDAPADPISISKLVLNNDCLEISYTAGGCDGSTWKFKLIDEGVLLESFPPQRNLRLSLKNEELCEALVSKDIAFDISNLQVDGNKIILNINNSGISVLYEY